MISAPTPVDFDAALKAFRAQFVGNDKHVLDAWLDDGFIIYQVNLQSSEEDLLAIPEEFMGVRLAITLHPKI